MAAADEYVFNPFVEGFDEDPAPVYRELRTRAPVYFWPMADAYLVSRFQDILTVLKDPRLSRSQRDGRNYQPLPAVPEYAEYRTATENSLWQVSQADHLRLRRLVNPGFTPRAIERLRGEILEITREALAGLVRGDVIDLAPMIDDVPLRIIGRLLAVPKALEPGFLVFARTRLLLINPGLGSEARDELVRSLAPMIDDVPLRIIGRLLAVPKALEPGFLVFARTRLLLINPGLGSEERDELVRSLAPGYRDIRGLIETRRRSRGQDLLSDLIHLEEEGTRLSEPELLGLIESIIIGGADTTVHTLRFMLLNLLRCPDQGARVRDDPTLARVALEETLRFDHFNKFGTPTYATSDLEIGGVKIPRGATVLPMKAAGSRDPEVFARPDEFDIDRTDLEALHNFGVGPHTCLGAHLARLAAEIVVPTILQELPGMRLAGPPEFTPHLFFRVMHRLPVRLSV